MTEETDPIPTNPSASSPPAAALELAVSDRPSARPRVFTVSVWLLLGMALTLGVMTIYMLEGHRARLPLLERARAAQWVLTTGWMVERYREVHGAVPSCSGGTLPCEKVLGWMAIPWRLERYEAGVEPTSTGYRVTLQGPEGAWTLEEGQRLEQRLQRKGQEPSP